MLRYFDEAFHTYLGYAVRSEGELDVIDSKEEMDVYRKRGNRRLAARTYYTKCLSYMWGARMVVEIIVDN